MPITKVFSGQLEELNLPVTHSLFLWETIDVLEATEKSFRAPFFIQDGKLKHMKLRSDML